MTRSLKSRILVIVTLVLLCLTVLAPAAMARPSSKPERAAPIVVELDTLGFAADPGMY